MAYKTMSPFSCTHDFFQFGYKHWAPSFALFWNHQKTALLVGGSECEILGASPCESTNIHRHHGTVGG